jgi:hypothetical protein
MFVTVWATYLTADGIMIKIKGIPVKPSARSAAEKP